MKKYELTEESIKCGGKKLFRIKALFAFGSVKAGELGGFVEKEENLSHDNRAWIWGDARVWGDAEIWGDAGISGDARISKPSHILVIGALGSRNGFITFFRGKANTILVKCGCFKGNIDEFEKAVEETHGGTKHEKTYKAAIELAKLQIDLED